MKKWLVLLLLSGCQKPDIDGWVDYTIPAGKHNDCFVHFPVCGSIKFSFTVDSSWCQESGGVNKIAGFTSGPIHQNSARLGWQWDGDKIMSYAYIYCDKIRVYEPLIELSFGIHYCDIVRSEASTKSHSFTRFRYTPMLQTVPQAVHLNRKNMKDLRKELIDFHKWLYQKEAAIGTIPESALVDEYLKSINSEAGNETPTVTDNEAKEEDFYRLKYEKCINVIKRFDPGIIGMYDL